jgi:hypothetical protein
VLTWPLQLSFSDYIITKVINKSFKHLAIGIKRNRQNKHSAA